MLVQETSIADSLSLIPSVVFSGLISGAVGAGIALYSTYLQNKNAAKRQKELLEGQLEQQKQRLAHESEQKRLEREMIMRRDIYLSGIESISKMQQFLMAFANVNQITESRENILVGTSFSLNKIGIIASFETLAALTKVSTCYNKNLVVLVEKRMEFDNGFQHKTNIENYIQNLSQRNQQLVAIHNTQNKTLAGDQTNILNAELSKNYNEIQENQKLVKELELGLTNQLAELLNLCFQATTELQKLGIDCVLFIRRELGFNIDEGKYKALITESAEKDSSYFTNWYQEIIEKHKL